MKRLQIKIIVLKFFYFKSNNKASLKRKGDKQTVSFFSF